MKDNVSMSKNKSNGKEVDYGENEYNDHRDGRDENNDNKEMRCDRKCLKIKSINETSKRVMVEKVIMMKMKIMMTMMEVMKIMITKR
jgi:hypothetical protein